MKRLSVVAIALLAVCLVNAQVTVNNELKALINQSFSYFPKIKEVENTVSTAKQKLELTQNNLPVVDANASYNFVEPKITLPLQVNGVVENFQFAPVHNLNANVSASYMLFDFGRLKANIQKSKEDIKYAEHNVESVKFQLANQVAVVFYNVIYYRRAIEIEDSVISYLNENKQIVESKLKNGDAIKLDLLSIQAQIDAEQNRKVDIGNYLQKQLNLLAYTTGNDTSKIANAAFDFDLPLQDVLAAMGAAQTNNWDFILAKDRIKLSQHDINLAKLGNKPSVNLGAGTGYKNGYVPNVNNLIFNYNAGISLRVPIYDGNRTKQQIKLSESIAHQNELAIESLNSNYKKDIQQAFTDIQSNLERINNSKGQIEQAETAKKLASSRYKNGVGTDLEITNASTNVQRAAFSKLQYEYQLCMARIELSRLAGYKYW